MYKLQIIKRKTIWIAIMLVLVFLSGCKNESVLKGHWISGDGRYSVSFDEDNTIVVDGKYIGKYEIYDKGRMAINVDTDTFDEVLDVVMSAKYSVTEDGIQIIDSETGKEFLYYTQEKVDKFINGKYVAKHNTYKGIREIPMYYPLGYFNEKGELIKESDWEFEGTIDDINKSKSKAEILFEKEVLSFYKSKNPNSKYHVFSDDLVGVDGAILHMIELRSEGLGTLSIVDRFLVESKEELIYIEDIVKDEYELWDGTIIDGVSLFER